MSETLKVGMADLKICGFPDMLTTLGLGSCVGITLYDPHTKISGMAHIMLPDSTKFRNNENEAKYADTGIMKLYKCMIEKGANPRHIVAKIAGGAMMFSFSSDSANELMRIGEKNVIATKEQLKKMNIRIIAEDTGLNYGRTITFNSANGELTVKTVNRDIKVI